jgi:hypothetical protein
MTTVVKKRARWSIRMSLPLQESRAASRGRRSFDASLCFTYTLFLIFM